MRSVPLKDAVLAWIPGKPDRVGMIKFPCPDLPHEFSTVGRVFCNYRNFDTNEQRLILLIESMQLIIRDRMDPHSVMQALCQVKQIRELFSDDTLHAMKTAKK